MRTLFATVSILEAVRSSYAPLVAVEARLRLAARLEVVFLEPRCGVCRVCVAIRTSYALVLYRCFGARRLIADMAWRVYGRLVSRICTLLCLFREIYY